METIDLTPTWSQHLNTCLLILDNAGAEGRKGAIEELRNMARVADQHVELIKKMPNGFDDWQETHFEMTTHVWSTAEHKGHMAYVAQQKKGTGGLWELAENITTQFEQRYKGHTWGVDSEEEWHEAIEDFYRDCEQRFNYETGELPAKA